MKYILIVLALCGVMFSCSKDENIADINVEGYWQIQDPTYTLNSTRNLFYLFRKEHAFYRYSFSKTHDFTNLTSRPNSDSIVSYFQVRGQVLMLPNPSASASNVVPENRLLSQTENEMVFTRYVIVKRSLATGEIQQSRTDTIRYTRVSDVSQKNYFDNYLKSYHP